jgi:betaine reductase
MQVVHYLNQFFGGLGGEEFAGAAPSAQDGAVGPGRLLEQVLGGDSKVVRTIVSGDNYAAENLDDLIEMAVREVRESGADLFIAGPCFEAGRYGVAAGALCDAVQRELGVVAVTAMALENPGVDLYRQELHIVDSGVNVGAMRDVLTKVAKIAAMLREGTEMGLPAEDGYIPRGYLRDGLVERSAAERMVEMLFAKTAGKPYESELVPTTFAPVPAPAPVIDLTHARVAIVTDGGLVPLGNPDKISPMAATNWGSYSVSGLDELKSEDYEVSHRGYDTRYVEQDPHRLVPLDALRELESEGAIGQVNDNFYATSGLANPLANSRRLGREIAQRLKEEEVDAVILTSA